MKKKKSHKLYALIVLVFGIVIISLSVLLLFHVQSMEIKGNEYTGDREIAEMVQNDKFSKNSLFVVGKYMIGKGEIPPCFDSMKVSLKAPWKLKITVKEKPIVAYMIRDKEYVYFDKDGLVVKKGSEFFGGVPCVEGIDIRKIELYQSLKSENSRIFQEMLETSQELARYKMTMEKIVCRKDRIYLYTGKICVSLGNNVTPEKIAHASKIMDELKGKEGTLHLENFSEGKTTITFDIGEFPKEK